MQDLSLHILDIAENSVDAGATRVEIQVEENRPRDRLVLRISDNGRGMDKALRIRAADPFVTTKGRRPVGLGLPLLAQAAEATGGALSLRSSPGRGTVVRAAFRLGHIDLKPLGDISQTLLSLIMGHQDMDFRFIYKSGRRKYVFDTAELRGRLGGLPVATPHAIALIRKDIQDGIAAIRRFP